jgi:transketolase
MALANPENNVYVLLGDGECNEGSIWEAFMFLGHTRIRNITIIIDKNNLQCLGYTKDIINQQNLRQRLETLGLNAIEINGHCVNSIKKSLDKVFKKTKVIVANTVKGKGVSFMENRVEWHYKSPNDVELGLALNELS